jgi:hypothetical protein
VTNTRPHIYKAGPSVAQNLTVYSMSDRASTKVSSIRQESQCSSNMERQ